MWISKAFKALGGWRVHFRITKKNAWYMLFLLAFHYVFVMIAYIALAMLWLVLWPFSLLFRKRKKTAKKRRTAAPSRTVYVDTQTGEVLGPAKTGMKKGTKIALGVVGGIVGLGIIGGIAGGGNADTAEEPAPVRMAITAADYGGYDDPETAPDTQPEQPETEAPEPETEPETLPPETDPPATDPPATEPPVTEPPQTDPPATEAPQTEPPATKAPEPQPVGYLTYVSGLSDAKYVLNSGSMKFHSPNCRDVPKIAAGNIAYVDSHRDDVTAAGYSPCGHCHP